MPKIFKQSDTKECRLLDDKAKPNAIVLDLTQHYVFKLGSFEKTVNSLVTLDMQNGMIQRHEEEWDGKHNATSQDGFFGKLAEWRKLAGAKLIDAFVTSDPSKV
jgi:beta-lactamase class D